MDGEAVASGTRAISEAVLFVVDCTPQVLDLLGARESAGLAGVRATHSVESDRLALHADQKTQSPGGKSNVYGGTS